MKIYGILFLIFIIGFTSCKDEWGSYYEPDRKSVDVKLWDSLKTMEKYSEFVKYLELYNLDTVVRSAHTKTLFIPGNKAFNEYLQNADTTGLKEILQYYITPTLFMVQNVDNKYKLKTLSEKYALIEDKKTHYNFDETGIKLISPLYRDGKYYEITDVIKPKPNLYQYLAQNNPVIKNYIDTQDTTILDKEASEPLGFNDQGETVYDSVTMERNLYEEEYFAVSEEYRDLSATLVLPMKETYESALDAMAMTLGSQYQSHEDIPKEWQNNVFIPQLLDKGTYYGMKDPEDFNKDKLANINGDSIKRDFQVDPFSRTICSNGFVYNYSSFSVGDSLYKEYRVEGEALVDSIGLNRYSWDPDKVEITGDESFRPSQQKISTASGDTVVNLEFTSNYQKKYSITFKMKYVFPNDYRIIWRTNYRTSGIYAIYVNGKRVKLGLSEYDQYDTYKLSSGFFSVLGYKLWPNNQGFCVMDGKVNNITEYGDITIRLEYVAPGESTDNGMNIDYVALLPM